MRFAIVELGVVVNVAEAAEPLGENWIASDAASVGDWYDGTTFSAPVPDWPAIIAARRYAAEIAGIDVGGMRVETDDRSKLLINGAAARASRDAGYVLRWKTPDGFIGLPADHVLIVADAVADHVQACFDREEELLDLLAGDQLQEHHLQEGWPGGTIPEPAAG